MSVPSLKLKKCDDYAALPPTPRGIFSHELSEFSGGRMRPKACAKTCVASVIKNLAQRDLDLSKKDDRTPIDQCMADFKNALGAQRNGSIRKSDIIKLRGEFQKQLFVKLGEQWAERMATSLISLPLPSSDQQEISKEAKHWSRQFINGSIYLYSNRKDCKECQPFLEALVDKTAEAFKRYVSDVHKGDEKVCASLRDGVFDLLQSLDSADVDNRVEYMKKCVLSSYDKHVKYLEAKRANSAQNPSLQAGERV